jgi:hypothetical protein
MKKASVVDTLVNIKVGDYLTEKNVIYKITGKGGGNYLLDIVWYNAKHFGTFKVGEKDVISRPYLQHFLYTERYKHVPKANKSTIEVLFS